MRSKILFAAVALALATSASAQFSRVAPQPSLTVSYTQTNAPDTESWQGADVSVALPVGSYDYNGTKINFAADVNSGAQQTHGGTTVDKNATYIGLGGTASVPFTVDAFTFVPYVRVGVQGNNGTLDTTVDESYVALNIEPGVVTRWNSVYGLVAYQYGEGTNADMGSAVSAVKLGLGVDLTKDWSLEGQFQMNRGSYNWDRTYLGVAYRF